MSARWPRIPLGTGGQKMRVEVLQPERVFTIRLGDGNWVRILALFPEDGVTRLVSRNHLRSVPPNRRV